MDEINSLMHHLFSGESRIYSSVDSIQGAKDSVQYPVEYLNSINTGDLFPSQLEVKIGVPLMLLRNLDPGVKGQNRREEGRKGETSRKGG